MHGANAAYAGYAYATNAANSATLSAESTYGPNGPSSSTLPVDEPSYTGYFLSNSQVAPDSQQGHQSIQASSTAASSKTKKLRSNSSKTKSPKRSRSRSRGRRRHKHRARSKSRERRRTRTKSKSRKGPRGHSKTKPKQQRRPETPERPPIPSAASAAPESQQASAADPNLDTWGPWDSSGKRTWPNTSYQSWYGQRSYSAHNTAHSSKGEYRRQSQEKGKNQRQGKGQSKSHSYGHPQAGYHSKGGASGKSQGKGKRKDKAKNDRTSSPNRMPLGQRAPSSSRGPDDRDTQVAEAEEYNYWSQAIQKAREDTSRIPVLAEIAPSEADTPRAVDQDEVQAVNHLILTEVTEVPENISHHMAEILLTKIPAEDLSGDNFSYLEMTDEGIGCTIAHMSQFLEVAPVFSMPDFSGDRHNLYHYTFSHGSPGGHSTIHLEPTRCYRLSELRVLRTRSGWQTFSFHHLPVVEKDLENLQRKTRSGYPWRGCKCQRTWHLGIWRHH